MVRMLYKYDFWCELVVFGVKKVEKKSYSRKCWFYVEDGVGGDSDGDDGGGSDSGGGGGGGDSSGGSVDGGGGEWWWWWNQW